MTNKWKPIDGDGVPHLEEVTALQHSLTAVFRNFAGEVKASQPAINLWVGDSDVVVSAELPGVTANDVDISLQGTNLTIRGTRPDSARPIERSVSLPFPVQLNTIETNFYHGVLAIRMKRAELS